MEATEVRGNTDFLELPKFPASNVPQLSLPLRYARLKRKTTYRDSVSNFPSKSLRERESGAGKREREAKTQSQVYEDSTS